VLGNVAAQLGPEGLLVLAPCEVHARRPVALEQPVPGPPGIWSVSKNVSVEKRQRRKTSASKILIDNKNV
jgi:hypothetical protein